MAKQVSQERSHIGPRKVRPLSNFNVNDFASLGRLGIEIPPRMLAQMIAGHATMDGAEPTMDALTASVTTGSIATPIQFLQNWLPGFVNVLTGARKIDELVGITTSGAWEDEEIVQGLMEQLGTSVPYTDNGNVPFSSWNVNFNYRTVVRFEEGMRVYRLEEARAARMNVNSPDQKRQAATLALEIQRNYVGFNGYNAGDNLTYGILNDPSLPNYIVFPNGATGASPLWSTKTMLEIEKDIRLMIIGLRTASQDVIDPNTTPITLALPTLAVDYLSVGSEFGYSVRKWLSDTYPNIRVVSAPELAGAHSSAGVAYMYAETVNDMSTDDGRVFIQVVPSKFRVVGVQTLAKGYEEDYSNATAGIMCKRPYAVIRYYGLSA